MHVCVLNVHKNVTPIHILCFSHAPFICSCNFIVKVIGELISCFFAPQRTLLRYKSPELLWSCSQVPSHVPTTLHCTWFLYAKHMDMKFFFFSEIMYAFYLVFPRLFRPWFRDLHGMTTSLIVICCQPHLQGRLNWLGKLGSRVWTKNMVWGWGRRGKLLRLLSSAKLLVEGGGGKQTLRVGWQETSSHPSYAFVYFSKSRPCSIVAGHRWPPITVTHIHTSFKREVCIVRCCLRSIATDDRIEPYWYREIPLGMFIAR